MRISWFQASLLADVAASQWRRRRTSTAQPRLNRDLSPYRLDILAYRVRRKFLGRANCGGELAPRNVNRSSHADTKPCAIGGALATSPGRASIRAARELLSVLQGVLPGERS